MKPAKFSKYILYLLLVVCLVAGGLFFFGGEVVSATGVKIPVYTRLLIIVMVALLGGALLVTILALIARFIERFRRSPKLAIRPVLGFFVFVFIMFFCWLCGSENLLSLQGYSGTYNTPVWLKVTDMFLYTTYILIGGAVILIIGFYVVRKVK